ncbi:hypothetical protein ACH470_27190 [Streptomyces bottropensis]|uniref:hypothetical protein n=1 Tax=Streptomyces bottropensis TaxID=42235 RepID=UPI0037A775F9
MSLGVRSVAPVGLRGDLHAARTGDGQFGMHAEHDAEGLAVRLGDRGLPET